MAEPLGISMGEWLSAVVTSIIAVIGGVMAWFSRMKTLLHGRVDAVETSLQAHLANSVERHATHTTDIEVVKTCQENTAQRLESIEETTRDTNQKLDGLIKLMLEKK